MELGDQDVDERESVPAELGHGEDRRGDDANGVCSTGRDSGFVDELCNYGFGENVEEIDEEGGSIGREMRRGQMVKEGKNGDLRLWGFGGGLEDRGDFEKLEEKEMSIMVRRRERDWKGG